MNALAGVDIALTYGKGVTFYADENMNIVLQGLEERGKDYLIITPYDLQLMNASLVHNGEDFYEEE